MALLPILGRAQADQYLDVQCQDLLALPGSASNLSIVDGKLYCCSAGLLLSIHQQQGRLVYAEADTAMVRIDANMDYVVRHPVSGNLFFTKKDRNGFSQLYERVVDDMGRVATRKVSTGGAKVSICHPTFSKEGRFMVFHTDDRIGFGGNDLWYCEYHRGKWSAPQNMGHRVNSVGDEIEPCICGDFLFFSAKGRKEGFGGFNLYAMRLLATRLTGDTVGMVPIGRSVIQMLPKPISTQQNDYALTLDPNGSCGYWIRRTADGKEHIYSFNGSLRGLQLSGTVTNLADKPLAGTHVSLLIGDTLVAKTIADGEGRYEFYLRTGRPYTLVFEKDNYFRTKEVVVPIRPDEERLIAPMTHSVQLSRLEFGVPFYYNDIFAQGASIELAEEGKKSLQQVVRFLQNNPHVAVAMTLYCDITADANFNRLATERRIQSIRQYLHSQDVRNVVKFENSFAKTDVLAQASGNTLLTIMLFE